MGARTILITGASSGIGAGLALICALRGNLFVLWGRNADLLNATAERCRARRQLTTDAAARDVRVAEEIASVNFTAPVVGANLLADRMAKRARGRIVIGSVAESFPLPRHLCTLGQRPHLRRSRKRLDCGSPNMALARRWFHRASSIRQ